MIFQIHDRIKITSEHGFYVVQVFIKKAPEWQTICATKDLAYAKDVYDTLTEFIAQEQRVPAISGEETFYNLDVKPQVVTLEEYFPQLISDAAEAEEQIPYEELEQATSDLKRNA
jgi:hypothetical protein